MWGRDSLLQSQDLGGDVVVKRLAMTLSIRCHNSLFTPICTWRGAAAPTCFAQLRLSLDEDILYDYCTMLTPSMACAACMTINGLCCFMRVCNYTIVISHY